ncbi:unnamed protein product [Hymenolepis diminuta]|uniref:Uncharacterized protein n=1 Tax=Hymenolepis diminuta TaxID=6216 RepID=A0A564YEL0_HYMDI|nr:unnamed protein product [Hymenolepis diminuta]
METSINKVDSPRLVSKPTVFKQQSVLKFSLFYHQTNQACRQKEQKEGCCTFTFPRAPKSFTKIRSLCLSR